MKRNNGKKSITTLYFVRHVEPNYKNHKDAERELTAKGLEDRKLVSQYLSGKNIDVVLSSPYKRAVDTVKHFADGKGLIIELIADFRERKVDSDWIKDFEAFCRQQWADFSYRRSDGETLGEVQERNIKALWKVFGKYQGKNIVVGTHGTTLSTIINYFDKSFGYEEFVKIKSLMPWIVKFVFQDEKLLEMEKINLFI